MCFAELWGYLGKKHNTECLVTMVCSGVKRQRTCKSRREFLFLSRCLSYLIPQKIPNGNLAKKGVYGIYLFIVRKIENEYSAKFMNHLFNSVKTHLM